MSVHRLNDGCLPLCLPHVPSLPVTEAARLSRVPRGHHAWVKHMALDTAPPGVESLRKLLTKGHQVHPGGIGRLQGRCFIPLLVERGVPLPSRPDGHNPEPALARECQALGKSTRGMRAAGRLNSEAFSGGGSGILGTHGIVMVSSAVQGLCTLSVLGASTVRSIAWTNLFCLQTQKMAFAGISASLHKFSSCEISKRARFASVVWHIPYRAARSHAFGS